MFVDAAAVCVLELEVVVVHVVVLEVRLVLVVADVVVYMYVVDIGVDFVVVEIVSITCGGSSIRVLDVLRLLLRRDLRNDWLLFTGLLMGDCWDGPLLGGSANRTSLWRLEEALSTLELALSILGEM